jgi:hypothetical protein
MWPHFLTGPAGLRSARPAARLDHLHQFERVQHAAKAGFRIGHDRREVVDLVVAFDHWIWSARCRCC